MVTAIVYDAETGRFRDTETGRLVARAAVRRSIEESLTNVARLTDTLADDLRAGRLSLTEWRVEMRSVIKTSQMMSAEVAHGGRQQMTQADYGRVGQQVRRQYEYLEKWVNEIQAGAPLNNRLEPRAALYLKSARTAYVREEARLMSEKGWLARSVTRPAEHCAECLAEEAKGLVEPRFIVPPGERTCLGNCKCYLQYERAA